MNKRIYLILILILLVAGLLRFYGLRFHDVINDEVFYGYRAIGLIDSLNSPFQPTPFEWYHNDVPAWAHFSFHDHPPLGFWIQNLFFKIFGENLLAMRLPFALAGVGSVFLVFLITRQLFERRSIALLASAIMAVTGYHVWISRIGLQEGLVIFFMLFAVWLFLKTLEDQSYFYWMVVATGLAVLIKYTAVILIPVFLIWLGWKRRDLLSRRKVFLSVGILLLLLTPVIVYNVGLYSARGHFDFQLSYLLGQDVPEWEVRPGRDVGGFLDRAQNLFVRFWQNSGIAFSVLTLLGLAGAWLKRKNEAVQFLILSFALLVLLLLVIGPQERFLAMLIPFLSILIAAVFFLLISKRPVQLLFVGLFLLAELAITVNTYHLTAPYGNEGVHYTYLRRDHELYGYNQLEDFLQSEMSGFYPAERLELKFAWANELSRQSVQKAQARGREPKATLFVTDSTLHGMSNLWYVTRHTVYEGWPMISDSAYLEVSSAQPDFFQQRGFEEVVFIKAEDTLVRTDVSAAAAQDLIERFTKLGADSAVIKSPKGREAFSVYRLKIDEN